MHAFSLLLILATVAGSQAWLFWGSRRQSARGDIDEECEAKARNGDCEFYTCFDVRHPCSEHNWALSYGWRYCMRFEQEFGRFSQEAQRWIEATRNCTMHTLLMYYQREHIVCEVVEEHMKDAHSQCEEDHGVCNGDMLMENREALMDVYKISRRALYRFLMFVHQCGGEGVSGFLDWVKDQKALVDPLFQKFKELFD